MFLVVSHAHGLLPFAHRLKLENQDVEALVVAPRFEKAWAGKLRKVLRNSQGDINPETLGPVVQKAEAGELVVLIDSHQTETVFSNAKMKYGTLRTDSKPQSVLRAGVWFDGESPHLHHALVCDIGVWPGGLGPGDLGGLTLIRVDNSDATQYLDSICQVQYQELKARGFKGLAQFGLNFGTQSGEVEVSGMEAGWPFLHTHAFLSELENFGDLMRGIGQSSLPLKFVTALPLTMPPWPNRKAAPRRPVEVKGLTPKQLGRVFWHDIQVEGSVVRTAGLDGLVGVIRTAADTSELSRLKAIEIASRAQIPEKQVRVDVGQRVQSTLAELEHLFGLSL